MKDSTRNVVFWSALALITAFGTWLRLHALGLSQLWLDEIRTAVEVEKGPLAIIKFTIADTGPLPLAYLLPWLASPLGPPEFALRFPDALFGCLTIPLAASTAWRLGQSRTAAIAAATIIAVSDHHLWYSRDARGYAVLAFISLLSFRLLIEAIEKGRIRWWIGLAFSGLAGHYTSYFYCFIPAALAIWGIGWLLSSARQGTLPRSEIVRRGRALTLALIVPIVLFVPWIVIASRTFENWSQGDASATTSGLLGVWLDRVMTAWLPAPRGWRFVVAGLIVAGDFMLPPARRGLLALTAIAPIAAACVLFSFSTSGHPLAPRYMIAAFPFAAVATGLGFSGAIELGGRISKFEYGGSGRRLSRSIATIAAALLLAVNCRTQLWGYFNQWGMMQRQDWKAVGLLLQQYLKPADLIVPGIETTYLPLDYYLSPELKRFLAPREWGTPEYMTQHVELIRASGIHLWYVAPGYAFTDNADMRKWFDENFKLFAVIPGSQSSIIIYVGPKAKSEGQ